MIEAVRIIRLAGRAFFDELYNLFVLSVLTTLTLVFIIPFPPAVVALWAVARRIAEGRIVGLRDWWEALKRYFLPAWGLALINIAVISLTVYNLGFYGQFSFSKAMKKLSVFSAHFGKDELSCFAGCFGIIGSLQDAGTHCQRGNHESVPVGKNFIVLKGMDSLFANLKKFGAGFLPFAF